MTTHTIRVIRELPGEVGEPRPYVVPLRITFAFDVGAPMTWTQPAEADETNHVATHRLDGGRWVPAPEHDRWAIGYLFENEDAVFEAIVSDRCDAAEFLAEARRDAMREDRW